MRVIDWSAAKNILIAVFLALNIFLFIVLRNIYLSNGIPENVVENTKKMLNASNIKVTCDIPLYNGKYQIMTTSKNQSKYTETVKSLLRDSKILTKEFEKTGKVEYDGRSVIYDNDDRLIYIDKSPEENNVNLDKESAKALAGKFITKAGLKKEDYVLEEIKQGEDGKYEILYIQKYKEFLIFNNAIKLVISDKGVESFSLRNRIPENFSYRNSQIKNAYEILLENYTAKSNITITAIDRGFKEESGVTVSDKIHTLGMVWRITTSDGQRVFFDALDDGAELK